MKGRNTHEPMEGRRPDPPSARSTGFVFAGVSLLAAFWLRHTGLGWFMLGPAALFAGLAWLRPALLEPLNRAWFRFSLLLSKVVTPIVMAILFYGFITPYGVLLRLRGRDPLLLKRTGNETTWWRGRGEAQNDMGKQF